MQHLTNRFHVAVHLFSNRSQMTSKCGKNTDVITVTTFWRLLRSVTESDARQQKKPFDVIYDLYKMKQFHWLLLCTCSKEL